MQRYYLGVDWTDQAYEVWVGDATGASVTTMIVAHTSEGLSEFERWLDERLAEGIEVWAAVKEEVWAAVKTPKGRIVGCLLDHGVVVYMVDRKAVDRAHGRFRAGVTQGDRGTAWTLAEVVRTDHPHLQPLLPNSKEAQAFTFLTGLVQRQNRLLNPMATLIVYFHRFVIALFVTIFCVIVVWVVVGMMGWSLPLVENLVGNMVEILFSLMVISMNLFSLAGIGFFAGIFLFVKGFIWLRQKHLIEHTPTSKIRSVALGFVEVFGEVIPAQEGVVRSPLSGADCVYYKYTIEEYQRGRRSSRWVTVKEGEHGIHFSLRDDTGSLLVDPKDARVDIPKDFECQSGSDKEPPEVVKQFLQVNNLSFESKTMRYTEYFIAPGDKLYIMGTAGDNPFVEEATAREGVEDVMIHKGENERFFYISDSHEREVLTTFKWRVIGGIWGGSFLTVVCLIIILNDMGLLSFLGFL
jgi:hypothetical protein